MTERPQISVLVPTYRYARYLPEAIDSVLAQEGADFELVVGDDASGDGTAEILGRYAGDPRVRTHIHPRNLGMVANWNWCLRQARGRYVKFLFGDDVLPDRRALARLAAMLDANPGAVLAASARLIIDEDSRRVDVWDELGEKGFHPGPEVIARCVRTDRNLVGEPSAVMFRKSAGGRGFDPAWRQVVDQEMWFHLLTQGGLVYEPEPLCAFRIHESQQTAVNRQDRVGVWESLILMARYLDTVAMAIGCPTDSFPIRRLLFHCLYYCRKDTRREQMRTPMVLAAEKELMGRLTPRWYGILWAHHRLTKPFVNALRKFRSGKGPGHRPMPPPPAPVRSGSAV
jgi:glycosyltransferase involved in cell wall biosynthesis